MSGAFILYRWVTDMGRLLEALRTETATGCDSAIPATLTPRPLVNVAMSQVSQRATICAVKPIRHLNPELPARVRLHCTEACKRLSIDPAPVLRQFDCWRYTEADLIEMDGWPTSTVMQHCLLLLDGLAEHFNEGVINQTLEAT